MLRIHGKVSCKHDEHQTVHYATAVVIVGICSDPWHLLQVFGRFFTSFS